MLEKHAELTTDLNIAMQSGSIKKIWQTVMKHINKTIKEAKK
jgi:hypothetical protein